jgi:DNA polymerase-1
MLVNILKDIKPDYIAACFDLPKPTFRHEVYKEYKGGRKKSDDELIAQIIRSRDIFKVFNIPIYELEGFEADDLLGTIVEQTKDNDDLDIVIASGDMDTLQLVKNTKVQVYTLKKGVKDTVLYSELAVKGRFGFVPGLLTDYKGLRGDPSDNIPGIKGIGEKTATDLIVKYGNLDGIYKELEKFKDEGDKKVIKENTGLTPRILALMLDNKDEAYFSKMLATIRIDADIKYELPKDEWLGGVDGGSVLELLSELELRSLMQRVRELLKVDTDNDDVSGVEEKSENTITQDDIDDIDFQEVATMLWLIKSDITSPTLDDILQFTNSQNTKTGWKNARNAIQKTLKDRDLETLYNDVEKPLIPIIKKLNSTGVLLDTKYLSKLSKEYHKELDEIEKEIYKTAGNEFNIRSPKQLGEVLFGEEGLGLKSKKKTASGQYSTNEKELKKLSDEHPIINKVFEYRELQKLLSTYVDNLPEMVSGKDGRLHTQFLQSGTTTGRMASINPNVQNIPTKTEHGKRVRKGFVAQDGNVLVALDYSQIELRIAAILSHDEKLMQIFKDGGDIHEAVAMEVFGVEKAWVTSQMRRRAKAINFGILYGMGVNALRVGLQDGGDEVSHKEAREYLATYFEKFSGLAKWIDKTKSEAQRIGYTKTLFGRRRYFEGLQSKLPFIRAAAERMAINAPVQGTSADVIKLATIKTERYIADNNLQNKAKLILLVHDELIYEMPKDEWEKNATIIKEIMEEVLPDKLAEGVPIIADIKHGNNWAEMV